MANQVGELSTGQKAKFVTSDKTEIPVQFNPSEYTLSRGGSYSQKRNANKSSETQNGEEEGEIQYLGSTRGDLELTLYFDTSEIWSGQKILRKAENVAKKTGQIENLAVLDPKKHRPPIVTFVWGKFQYKGFVTEVKTTFTMFTENGMPIRAKMSVTMHSVNNPRIPYESPDRTKTRILSEDSSIWAIARAEYGDSREWRRIAKANGIMNPFELETGWELKVPAIMKEDIDG